MMRKPLERVGRKETVISRILPAPIHGWNTKDSIAEMKESDAIVLDNWFPRQSDVALRKGATDHSTGYAKAVESLHPFNKLDGTYKLFAATDDGLFDATAAGAVGATVAALTSGDVISSQSATSAGVYLTCVNGTDYMWLYNGTTWTSITAVSTPAITGVATTELTTVHLHKKRLFFTRTGSRSIYYLPADSIAGALVEFPCGAYLRKGGYIVAMGSWTVDAGEGSDDHLMVVSSEGQLLMFKGTDPSSPAAWALVGAFDVGEPLGKRCFINFGGDLIYLSTNGAASLTKALTSSAYTNQIPFSDKIYGAFYSALQGTTGLAGWSGTVLRPESMMLINVPLIEGGSVQFVMNVLTGSWCRFTGWSANCITVVDNKLYFGDSNSVFQGMTGSTDFGGNIQGDAALAYSYFGNRGKKKKVVQVRPVLSASSSVEVSVAVSTDFEDNSTFGLTPAVTSTSSLWDTATWDTSTWGGSTTFTKNWIHTPSQVGYCHSVKMRISSRVSDVLWSAKNVLLKSAASAP